MKKTQEYYKKGFQHINSSLVLFGFGVWLVVASQLFAFLQGNRSLASVVFLIAFGALVVDALRAGYDFIIPKLLEYKQSHKTIPISYIQEELIKTTIRLIPVFLIVIVVLFVCIGIFLTLYTLLANTTLANALTGSHAPYMSLVLSFIGYAVSPFLGFTYVYYSLGNESFFRALYNSIKTGYAHFSFTAWAVMMYLALWVLTQVILTFVIQTSSLLIIFPVALLQLYVAIGMNASYYVYYKRHLQ